MQYYSETTGTCLDPVVFPSASYAHSAVSATADWILRVLPIWLRWDLKNAASNEDFSGGNARALYAVSALYVKTYGIPLTPCGAGAAAITRIPYIQRVL